MNSGHFTSFDNNEIFYREWNYLPHQKTIIMIHRGHEHSERLNDIAQSPQFSKYNIFAFDLRGHGLTKTKTSSVFMDY
ncbi:alpha/beta hydrolase, partial [Chryseobacterium artocarpi]|uniref:alpha/beta hydrolase n=1 Tax=Chryseobacterium artocarpi TaxID=1414727 RepID=UPI003F2A7AC6